MGSINVHGVNKHTIILGAYKTDLDTVFMANFESIGGGKARGGVKIWFSKCYLQDLESFYLVKNSNGQVDHFGTTINPQMLPTRRLREK